MIPDAMFVIPLGLLLLQATRYIYAVLAIRGIYEHIETALCRKYDLCIKSQFCIKSRNVFLLNSNHTLFNFI